MDMNLNSWTKFKGKIVEPLQYIEELNKMLASFLQSKEEYKYETKEYFKHSNTSTDTIEEIKKQKNMLNKKAKKQDATEEDTLAAIESICFYNYLVKLKKERNLTKLAIEQEKAYKKDFWKTARNVTNGSFGKQTSCPTFDKPQLTSIIKVNMNTKCQLI